MKSTTQFINALLLIVAIAVMGSSVSAQERGAILSSDGQIFLPTQEPLKADYSFNVGSLGFASELDAVNYFKDQSEKTHFFRMIPGQGRAVLYLDLKANPEWEVSDWNKYLEDKKLGSIDRRE